MNENIDLTKILKNCPKGTKLYTPVWGEVTFIEVRKSKDCFLPICIATIIPGSCTWLTKEGCYSDREGAECVLFPSKDQRDWSKFTAPWHKKEKFDPKTLKAFDRVMVRDDNNEAWFCTIFSHLKSEDCGYPYNTASGIYVYCIPYNCDTKHLVGTTEEAPEYYRYWEE